MIDSSAVYNETAFFARWFSFKFLHCSSVALHIQLTSTKNYHLCGMQFIRNATMPIVFASKPNVAIIQISKIQFLYPFLSIDSNVTAFNIY